MDKSILSQISALQRKSVSDLQAEWLRLYGEPTRSRNRDYLWKRLAWRVQELAHGGLSDASQQRIDDLASDGFVRARTPRSAASDIAATAPAKDPPERRNPKLPTPGTVFARKYFSREIRVVTLDDGFEWDGRRYGSLSAVARAVTGSRWNGRLFFGLTKRQRSQTAGRDSTCRTIGEPDS